MPPKRLLLARSLLALIAVVAALGLGEMAARIGAPRRPVFDLRGLHVYRPDRPSLYGLRPGAEGRFAEGGKALYRINEDGFRGPRLARPKPPQGFRVLVLGDSIAFGYEVEEAESFPRVLESALAERVPGAGIEVVNLGVGGYNAWNEAKLLEDVGVGYQPDLVLVQFCINDLNDPTMHFDGQTRVVLSSIPDDAFPDPSRRRGSQHAPSRWADGCARSSLCTLARELWLARFAREFDDAAKRAAFVPVESEAGPEWSWLERRYLEIAAAAEGSGARFSILLFPYPGQVARQGRDPVREQMLALGRRHGWTIVDPLPAFRTAHARGTLLFFDWWHPTVEGHRIAAEETLRVLACAGELGEKARGSCPGGAPPADGSGGE